MRIGILGAGAMGSLLAADLTAGGVDAVLLARPSDHVARIQNDGLRVEDPNGSARRIAVRLALDPAAVAEVEALVVLVKRWATDAAIAAVAGRHRPQSFVLSLQNGLGARNDLLAALPLHPPRQAVHGATSQAALLVEPGVVRHAGVGPTLLGVPPGIDSLLVHHLASVMNRAGWPTTAEPDIEPAIWRKLAVNAAINGITALAGLPNGAIVHQPGLRHVAERMAGEVGTVATSLGIDIGDAPAATIGVAAATAVNRSSMLQDLDRGRRTEVEAIHGAVVRIARERGVAVPLTDCLAKLIRARELQSLNDHGSMAR